MVGASPRKGRRGFLLQVPPSEQAKDGLETIVNLRE